MLTVERLRELLSYDPDTGMIAWKGWRANRNFTGRPAGRVNKRGYVYITIEGKKYLAHRVAWAIHHGFWPEYDLDHRDLDKTNQQLVNLRSATDVENGYNRSLKSDNTSGYKGVSMHSQSQRWQARISVNKKRIWLGFFDTAEEARDAYMKAAVELHGDFARTS